jgi:Orsellinic acid/F9775 biosynthesis cluster protein D
VRGCEKRGGVGIDGLCKPAVALCTRFTQLFGERDRFAIPTIIMTIIEPFVYLPEYRVVVCTKCKYGMSAGSVRTHLAGRQPGILDDEKASIAEEISNIPGIIQDEQELDGFQFPSPATKAILELAEPKTDGLGCKMC